jgi:hypothetical protein
MKCKFPFCCFILVTLGWIPSPFNSPSAEPLLKLRLRDVELWLCSIACVLGVLADPLKHNNRHRHQHSSSEKMSKRTLKSAKEFYRKVWRDFGQKSKDSCFKSEVWYFQKCLFQTVSMPPTDAVNNRHIISCHAETGSSLQIAGVASRNF